jgi:hypothetical protein
MVVPTRPQRTLNFGPLGLGQREWLSYDSPVAWYDEKEAGMEDESRQDLAKEH